MSFLEAGANVPISVQFLKIHSNKAYVSKLEKQSRIERFKLTDAHDLELAGPPIVDKIPKIRFVGK